jgi:preprotein translocase subunit SecY
MSLYKQIIFNLPEVSPPTQKRLSFKEKLKWTGIILFLFYILGLISLAGLGDAQRKYFESLQLILGAKFGTVISLGIGPIVTASIVLQLLNGSGLLKFDLNSPEGKKTFQGTQKLMAIAFIIFEAGIYVFMGGLPPPAELAGTSAYFIIQLLLIFQLFIGGLLILFMDEVISKWGFGSGISLFIAAGVSEQIFIRAFNWFKDPNIDYATGAVIALIQAILRSDLTQMLKSFAPIMATIIVFVLAVYGQAMKIEIPLSFGRVRGHGIRWPLSFIYTSNIPVILVAALFANLQVLVRLLNNANITFLGTVDDAGRSGFISYLSPTDLVGAIISRGGFNIGWQPYLQALVYTIIFMIGCVIFAYFWVQTSGMDAKSQAQNILKSGLQIPGFRKDQRILERLLNRYIGPLTVMGALTVGLLAALADLSGALTSGTGLLLTVMIIYRLYEEIAQQHMTDMNPMLRKMME